MFSKIVSKNSNAMNGAQQNAFTNKQTRNQFKNTLAFVCGVNASKENRIRQTEVARLTSPITCNAVLE